MLYLQIRPNSPRDSLAESNGSLLPGLWRDSLHVTCWLTASTPGSAPGPTLGNKYGKTLPFYRVMLCMRGTSHQPVSVCLCLSQVGVRLKRLHTNNTTGQPMDSSFLTPKISAKFDRGKQLRGRLMQVGWVIVGDFRQITG